MIPVVPAWGGYRVGKIIVQMIYTLGPSEILSFFFLYISSPSFIIVCFNAEFFLIQVLRRFNVRSFMCHIF